MKTIFYSILALTLMTCSGSDSDNVTNGSDYQGNWSGTFSGDDSGTWTASINSVGEVSGIALSTTFSDTYALEGSVSASGQFQATLGTSSAGGVFTGQLGSNSGSGTWVNETAMMSGSWSGTKD
jgi:hypothetical protein